MCVLWDKAPVVQFVFRDGKKTTVDFSDETQFRKCGTTILTKRSKLAFVNRGYSPHPTLPAMVDEPDTIICFTYGNLSNVTALRIVIRQMLSGSVPSLTDLHIWGRPGKQCTIEMKRKVFTTHNARITQRAVSNSDGPRTLVEAGIEATGGEELTDDSQSSIPDDMLDPITLEMMRFPVLLPSGHTVDRSTLDKHVKSQADFGNPPSDPFTGIAFCDSSKPFPNVKLKVRIDNYCLHYKKVHSSYCGENTSSHSNDTTQLSRHTLKSLGDLSTRGLIPSNSSTINFKRSCADDQQSRQLQSSLEASLREMGNSLTKRRKIVTDDGISTMLCSKCSAFLFSHSVRYLLPCSRIVCGNCVTDSSGDVRCQCSSIHEYKSVKRTFQL